MERAELTRMTRIEVVVRGDDVAAVQAMFKASGATGFTMLSGVAGLGHGGYHQGPLLFNEHDAQAMLITVVPDDRASEVLDSLRGLLAERPGVMFVSDTYVSRPEYFS